MEDFIYLLVGTYTKESSEGVYVYKFNTLTGESEYVSLAKVDNPSYLAVYSNNQIFAVSENEKEPSYANALSLDIETGDITLLNREETKGNAPCNIAVDPKGTFVVTSNYGGGSISAFRIKEDGKLSPVTQVISFSGKGTNEERQEAPHLHCVRFSPDGKYIFATDLGTDHIYRFDIQVTEEGDVLDEASLKKYKVADGSGPRHLEFHPAGDKMYLINELAGTVIGFYYKDGELEEFQTIKADLLNAQGSGDIAISPDGKFVYASNRLKGDGIAIFSIHEQNGRMSKVGYQPTDIHPRNMVITPDGKFLLVANMEGHTVEIYQMDHTTGLLRNIDKNILINMPVCLKFIG